MVVFIFERYAPSASAIPRNFVTRGVSSASCLMQDATSFTATEMPLTRSTFIGINFFTFIGMFLVVIMVIYKELDVMYVCLVRLVKLVSLVERIITHQSR